MGIIDAAGTVEQGGIDSTNAACRRTLKPMEISLFGTEIHYVAGEKVINLSSEIFGFNGCSSAIQNIQIDFADEHAQTGKASLGLSVRQEILQKDMGWMVLLQVSRTRTDSRFCC